MSESTSLKDVSGSVTTKKAIHGNATNTISMLGAIQVGNNSVKELCFCPISEFPEVGFSNVLYIDTENDAIYFWDGFMYRSIPNVPTIIAKTKDEWNAQPSIISEYGAIYIYTDYRVENENAIPAVKIGDGLAYVVDLSFFDTGVTEEDRRRWDNKVSCIISPIDPENLIFYNS